MGLLRIRAVFSENLVVFLQGGPAARRVGQNGVELIWIDSVYILSGECHCVLFQARMKMERATAALTTWDDHLAAICPENSHSSLIQASERNISDATGQEGYAIPVLLKRGIGIADFREEEWRFGIRRQGFERGKISEGLEYARCANDPLQPTCLIEIKSGAGGLKCSAGLNRLKGELF